jgi:hypothetical protein
MRSVLCKSIIVAVFAVAATGNAQSTDKPKPTAKVKKPAVDPEAIAALKRMGDFVRQQQSFTVRTRSETDFVLDNGQKVTRAGRGELRARRPDRLRTDVVSETKDRHFFYDGKTFTIFGKKVGYYATVPAPATIRETIDELEDRYGLELPLVDLFRVGTPESGVDEITEATFIGPTKIDGVDVDHYAFRQPGLDWQVWIERGNTPLPRKIVMTTTDDPARPEHAVELTWDLNAKHEDAVFVFVPPKDSIKIPLAELIPSAEKRQRPKQSAQR